MSPEKQINRLVLKISALFLEGKSADESHPKSMQTVGKKACSETAVSSWHNFKGRNWKADDRENNYMSGPNIKGKQVTVNMNKSLAAGSIWACSKHALWNYVNVFFFNELRPGETETRMANFWDTPRKYYQQKIYVDHFIVVDEKLLW